LLVKWYYPQYPPVKNALRLSDINSKFFVLPHLPLGQG
jgi:hypothetical protein